VCVRYFSRQASAYEYHIDVRYEYLPMLIIIYYLFFINPFLFRHLYFSIYEQISKLTTNLLKSITPWKLTRISPYKIDSVGSNEKKHPVQNYPLEINDWKMIHFLVNCSFFRVDIRSFSGPRLCPNQWLCHSARNHPRPGGQPIA